MSRDLPPGRLQIALRCQYLKFVPAAGRGRDSAKNTTSHGGASTIKFLDSARTLAFAGISVFGVRGGTEEPGYRVIANVGQVQIRRYEHRLAASVTVPGDEIPARSAGFRRLARYIFGANTQNISISMTAPVAQSAARIAMTVPVAQAQTTPGEWTITFTLPSKYTMATLPKPVDPGIRIHELEPETDAVYRFSGIPRAAPVAKAREALLLQLVGSDWQVAGATVDWFYDPPWTLPWVRRNEVAVPVVPRAP